MTLVVFTAACVLGLLASERVDSARGKWITKPLASAGFLAIALVNGALETPFGIAVLVALALSWIGDVLFIPNGAGPMFRSGVLAFLAAHVAFLAAFVVRGVSLPAALGSLVVLVPLGAVIGPYFVRRVSPDLRVPVTAYIVVLSTMVALAVATHARASAPIVVVAAIAFYLSDLSVALDRFVKPSFVHRAWGIPLYYAAQVLFALALR